MVRLPRTPSLPRLPFVPDPLRRIKVPKDLEAITTRGPEVAPEDVELTRHQVEDIWEGAEALYRSGVHPALQVCLRRRGKVFLDRAIGHARGNGPRDPGDAIKVEATPDTPFCIFSASKAVTAMVVHLLHERGALDIADKIADYIPEYASRGKENTTIAHVLAHRAGVASLPEDALDLDKLADREFLVKMMCDAEAASEPGKFLAYHAVSGGFILAEIVERVTNQTIRTVLQKEILSPLNFRWGNYGVDADDVEAVGVNYTTGPPLVPPLSNLANRVLGMPVEEVVELSNDPRFLTGIVPAGNVITTANELGRFFEIFRAGGELDGKRIMKPETIARAVSEQSHLEIDFSLVFPTRFSYGLMLGADLVSLYGRHTDLAFGHLGLINIMGWGDPERALSGGVITSGKAIVYPEVTRFYGLLQRIASQVPKVAAQEMPEPWSSEGRR